jgi:hypothetical protein
MEKLILSSPFAGVALSGFEERFLMVQDKKSGAPQTYETLIHTISRRHSELGSRAKEVARYIMQNPDLVALGSAKDIADDAGIHPSILVRFAQHESLNQLVPDSSRGAPTTSMA